jgi:hypothetical protein
MSKSSLEGEIVSPIHTTPLVVPARVNSQSDRRSTVDDGDWNKEAPVQLRVVSRNRVDLGC